MSKKIIGAIVTMHLVLAYITGLNVEPFESAPWYVLIVIPVVIALGIGLSRLNPIFKNYKYYSLRLKLKFTATTPWVWVLLFLSSFFVVGSIWYGGQILKLLAETEYTSFFGEGPLIHMYISLVSCVVVYSICIHLLYKTLKKIWKN